MHPRFLHPSAAERDHPAGTGLVKSPSPGGDATDLMATLTAADRACCCLAKPVVMVVLPPTARRAHVVDLLLCGHHYHVSKDALTAASAIIHDSRDLPAEARQESPNSVIAR
jgi:hypothetical protein